MLEEEEKVASRIRFGLFSQPPPIAIGDDAGYSKLIRNLLLNNR